MFVLKSRQGTYVVTEDLCGGSGGGGGSGAATPLGPKRRCGCI